MNNKNLFFKLLGVYGIALSTKIQDKAKHCHDGSDQNNLIISMQTSDLSRDLDWNIGCGDCSGSGSSSSDSDTDSSS